MEPGWFAYVPDTLQKADSFVTTGASVNASISGPGTYPTRFTNATFVTMMDEQVSGGEVIISALVFFILKLLTGIHRVWSVQS